MSANDAAEALAKQLESNFDESSSSSLPRVLSDHIHILEAFFEELIIKDVENAVKGALEGQEQVKNCFKPTSIVQEVINKYFSWIGSTWLIKELGDSLEDIYITGASVLFISL